jgi:hypothetical protein
MTPLRSVQARIFLAVAALSALHFATHVVREHYPAFALASHGSLRCDDWVIERTDPSAPGGVRREPLHPDLFLHRDGHWYANNNPGASLLAAPALFLFEPLLSKLEEIGRGQAAADREPARLESEYPLRRKFMAEVRRRGLHLRLGAATAITSALVMAPLAGLLAVLLHGALLARGVAAARAPGLALLFAFATPLLFRSAVLNHNQMQAPAAFASFCLISRAAGGGSEARRSGSAGAISWRRLAAAGALAGATVLLDYSGAVLLAGLAILLALVVREERGARSAAAALVPFAAGAAVPVALLLLAQLWQFGNAFLPAQRWMPDAHFSVRGWHGFDLPSPDLLLRNLLDPSFGLFAFAPILLLALVPPRLLAPRDGAPGADGPAPLLSRRERAFVLALSAAFLLFCSANQFARLQWNTGFRALAPLVPFLFLGASDALVRLKPRVLAVIALPCVLHSWVLAMARATPPVEPARFADSTVARSWAAFLERGVELPWLTVWRQTRPGGGPGWAAAAAPLLVLGTVGGLALLWWAGSRAAARQAAGARR